MSFANSDLFPYLQTSQGYYWYNYNGNTTTVTNGTKLGNLVGQLGGNLSQSLSQIYSVVNSIKDYVDGIEGYIDGLETSLSTTNTHLNNIKGYVDGIETLITTSNTHLSNIKTNTDDIEGYVDDIETGITAVNTNLTNIKSYVDGLEGYVDGLETAFNLNNTRLNEIKNAIQNITTYNYTQVLSDILSNTGYLSVIDTYTQSIQDSIGYGSSIDNVQTKLSSIINWTSETNSSVLSLIDEYENTQQISTPIQERSTVTGTLTASSKTTPLLVRFLSRSGNSPYKSLESVNGTLTLYDYFHILNNNLIGVNTALVTTGTSYNYRYYNDDMTTGTRTIASLMDMLMMFSGDMSKYISRMAYIFADPDTISAKQANKNQEQTVLSNFTGQGNASASVDDFNDISSSVQSVNNGLNTGVSISNIVNIYNNRDGYGFWSTETQNELNTSNNSRLTKNNRGSDTPLYDSKLSEIYSYMGVNND